MQKAARTHESTIEHETWERMANRVPAKVLMCRKIDFKAFLATSRPLRGLPIKLG